MSGLTTVGLIAACICWKTRRRRLSPSKSFTEQEKKLLDSSLATSCDRQSIDVGSSYGFEMIDRSTSLDSGDSRGCMETVHITLEHTGIYPPPPVEFALPAAYGNIFISLRLSGTGEEYPDLLGGGATLPRRSKTCTLNSANDNVSSRNAASSSTWSLPEDNATDDKTDNNIFSPFSRMSTEFTAL
ncbi:unnamed protein product, partial [Iphiclides podalirius]